MQHTPIKIEDYKICCLLGEGGQANVYLGKKQLKLFAVKVYLNKPSRMNTYLNEVKLLQKVNFINIINMVQHKPQAIIQYVNNLTEKSPIVVLEFADHGELFNLVSKTGRLEQIVCRTLFKQLIAAIKYLDEVKVAHRDIKMENILFDNHFNLKLSDFGLAKSSEGENNLEVLHSNVGTKAYKAPEIIQQNYNGLKVDLFAAAVTLFVMFTRAMPFNSTSKSDETYNLIRNNKIQIFWGQLEYRRPKGFYSPSFKQMISALFSSIPEKRPTLEELENCDWMKEPILSNQELKVKLTERYNKMYEKDEVMKKIKKEQLDLLKMKLEQKQENSQERLNESSFDRDYFDLKIDIQDLPVQNMHGVVYTKISPCLLVYYIRNYLKEQFESGNSFMNDYHLDIRPLKYELNVKEKNQISLNCQFQIGKQSTVNLEISGQILREQGSECIGIKWKGVQGNEIWMSAIISEMIKQQEYL